MYFDSHAHYDDNKFDKDRDKLIKDMKKNGVDYIVNVGADLESSAKSIDLAKKYDFVYATVGVHPHDVKELSEEDMDRLYGLGSQDEVVAFGEIGLDFYYDNSPRELQKEWFIEQIELAKELELPVVIHSRDADQATFDIVKEYEANMFGGVIHCFSGSAELAKEYVKDGWYIGVGGVITFPKAKNIKLVVEAIPLESILIETDAPYLAPVPQRGKRNDSNNLQYIVEAIAEIKGVEPEEVAKVTMENAKKFYGIEQTEVKA